MEYADTRFFAKGLVAAANACLHAAGSNMPAAVIRKNCTSHLQAAIGILQPTLVVSQGSGLVQTLRVSFGVTHP